MPDWAGPGEASTGALRQWAELEPHELEAIESEWVKSIRAAYVKDKNFVLVNRRNFKIYYFGQLGAGMIDLLRTTRGQPKASVAP